MTKRFRMIAGPNGSGKSTLAGLLRRDYAVNFYAMLNADDIFAEVSKTHAYLPSLPVEGELLLRYARQSEYTPQTKSYFENGDISVVDDTVRFKTGEAINTYTIALLTNFLQSEHIASGKSFSQETVFSHPSKVAALKSAEEAGYRTYLYFVATSDIAINIARIASRVQSGGHSVPEEKVVARSKRTLENVGVALSFCSRAFFFDNSMLEMRFLAEYSKERGFVSVTDNLPAWFETYVLRIGKKV